MKKIKMFIVIIFLLIICVGILLMIITKKNGSKDITYDDTGLVENLKEEEIKKDVNKINFYKVKSCINSYISIVNKNNTAYYSYDVNGNMLKIIPEEEIRKSIYNLLSQRYINENKITQDNVYNFVDDINENLLYNILDISCYENNNSDQYIIYGYYQNLQNQFIKYAYYIVNINDTKNIFSIEPIKDSNIDLKNINDTEIVENDNNTISSIDTDNENVCSDYLISYKRLMLSNPDEAYKFLNEEYKQKRYDNVNGFKEYINLNREKISGVRLDKYSISVKEDYTQYICIDQYGNYYIFTEKGIMDYEVILDAYTIDLPQFLEKYEEGTEQVKVGMNIEKFISAINAKDYRYAYNCLADSFKNNYYQTQESFEDYVKNNFFENNKIEYIQFSKEGNNYVYDIKILNTQGEEEKQATIIMQLHEGTEFVMSFSLE